MLLFVNYKRLNDEYDRCIYIHEVEMYCHLQSVVVVSVVDHVVPHFMGCSFRKLEHFHVSFSTDIMVSVPYRWPVFLYMDLFRCVSDHVLPRPYHTNKDLLCQHCAKQASIRQTNSLSSSSLIHSTVIFILKCQSMQHVSFYQNGYFSYILTTCVVPLCNIWFLCIDTLYTFPLYLQGIIVQLSYILTLYYDIYVKYIQYSFLSVHIVYPYTKVIKSITVPFLQFKMVFTEYRTRVFNFSETTEMNLNWHNRTAMCYAEKRQNKRRPITDNKYGDLVNIK